MYVPLTDHVSLLTAPTVVVCTFVQGAGPDWNCGACMTPGTRLQNHSKAQNCTDPTYHTEPVMNPTCMAQFNESADDLDALRACRAERDAQAVVIEQLRARLAELGDTSFIQ